MNNLPHDPVMLLSVINTKLRDVYASLDDLTEDMDVDKEALITTLSSINYEYDEKVNQFV